MSPNVKGVVAWCRRYLSPTLLVVVAFVFMLLFFNDNSVMRSLEYGKRIEELKLEIQQNRDTFLYYDALNRALDTDRETMERIVRERYHMQRPNEDVYVVK